MDRTDLQLRMGRLPRHEAAQLRTLYARISVSPGQRGLEHLFETSAAARELLLAVNDQHISDDRCWIDAEDIHLLDPWSVGYPSQLGKLPDAPGVLYVAGDVASLSSQQLAIVGSRRPTHAGRRIALNFARRLARAGLTITSGLAEGIDAASHEGALSEGRSIAVLGTGIDQIYPRANTALARRIMCQGALVSELPPRSPPLRRNFPLRNRIISGLSLGVLVVEAAQDSGSLITAGMAKRQDRRLFAVPGSIHNPLTRGPHALIRQGAQLVEEAADILRDLGIDTSEQILIDIEQRASASTSPGLALDKHYKILLDAVGFEAASVNALAVRTGLPSQSVASMLLSLELAGAVGSLADGQYVRLSPDDHASQRF